MATKSTVGMFSEMRMIGGGGDGFNGEDLGMLLREQRIQEAAYQERELNLYRSGSAPPTVEGSFAAVGGFFGPAAGFPEGNSGAAGLLSEEEILSDPAYHSYYYSNAHLNPRLPPPVLTKEDWRLTQRLQAGSSAIGGDWRKVVPCDGGESRSLFSIQPSFGSHKEDPLSEPRKGGDGLIGIPRPLGRQKSFAEIFKDDPILTEPASVRPSRPSSRNAFHTAIEPLGSTESQLAAHNELGSLESLWACGNSQSSSNVQSIAAPPAQTFASVLSSASRSNTPDPQLKTVRSPCLPPVGAKLGSMDKKNNNGSYSFGTVQSGVVDSSDLVDAFMGMDLTKTGELNMASKSLTKLQHEFSDRQDFLSDAQSSQGLTKQLISKSSIGHSSIMNPPNSMMPSYPDMTMSRRGLVGSTNQNLRSDVLEHQRSMNSSSNLSLNSPSASVVTSPGGSPAHVAHVDSPSAQPSNFGLGGYAFDPTLAMMMVNSNGSANLSPLYENAVAASTMVSAGIDSRALGSFTSSLNLGPADLQSLDRLGNQANEAALQIPLMDPLYIQHLRNTEYASQFAAVFGDNSAENSYLSNSYADLLGIQKAYPGSYIEQPKQYSMAYLGKSGGLANGYYGTPAFGLGLSYPGSPLASPVFPGSPVGSGSPLRLGERGARYSAGMRSLSRSSWNLNGSGNIVDGSASSLLEEFKNNKAKFFELSDIAGHVVGFSSDQYGSRFIQQKLETASTEEKNMVFEEIMPHALSLMTDVFGNYVVQKFFENGAASQIRELADQLIGNVLTLSLQMYGCRVIQKAIEVVGLDQQTKMVVELDGHIMRCVRDQNGNHVIQKCIECIPQEAIQFIILTFFDQVVALSTHPYGCRVIQRVLEHCTDPKTQKIVMDEIMQCVCMLAQDQYGNYVVQHVLEHGKPHEKSAIIGKLAGQIVQMSQQKFASNVVEKCLTFGGDEERQLLVNEMLGTSDDNEPLQAMMKDQFANYVVQKVLETCDDHQRELILSRIKVHLSALKKYTYGKHIVARVEKLVTAGERRIGAQAYKILEGEA